MESGSSLLSMVNSGQVGRALKVYGSWQCEMYCALERVSGRSARSRADRASVTRVEMRFWRWWTEGRSSAAHRVYRETQRRSTRSRKVCGDFSYDDRALRFNLRDALRIRGTLGSMSHPGHTSIQIQLSLY